jgi:hypothetical protein
MRRSTVAGLVAAAVILLPVSAMAKGGDGTSGGDRVRTGTGTTTTAPVPATPAQPAPETAAADCVELSPGDNDGKPGELEFVATSCSAKAQTLKTSFVDQASRVLYPAMSCGTGTYAGPTVTVPANGSVTFTMPTRRGTCVTGAAESHFVTVTALNAAGTELASTSVVWQEKVKTYSS